jgi:RimJ/RimL family protein N-acetyltransferase
VTSLSSAPVETERLSLPVFTGADIEAMTGGLPRSGWAPGYPREDDVDLARHLAGLPAPGPDELPWWPRHVIHRESGMAVGSTGFFGPPDVEGTVEIGYGLVEQARGSGLAGEAVGALLAAAAGAGAARVIAHTLPGNAASQAVLHRAGFAPAGVNDEGELRFEHAL